MEEAGYRFTDDDIECGRLLFARPARFMLGVARLDQLPPAEKPEIAFAGRSNVGKSSLINALTGVHELARASNTPGRTRELNFFDIAGQLILVDMPGYGYAKAAKAEVKKWQALLKAYLRGRPGLTRVFVLIDARHGAMSADQEMFDLLDEAAVAYQLVLTKIDKLKPGERTAVQAKTLKLAKAHPAALALIHQTSSVTDAGLPELRAEIAGLVG